MSEIKVSKDGKLCIFTIAVILVSYAAERLIELFIPQGKTLGIVLAMVYTLLLAFTVYVISKTKEIRLGLLAALLAYKMMPVNISFLYLYSQSADVLFFIVKKAAMIMFAVLIYKLYCAQDKDRRVTAPTVFAIIFSVPFFTEISDVLFKYFLNVTGSMLFGYFSQFAFYALASFVILGIAYYSGAYSLRFAAGYEIIALIINTVKVGAKIGYRIINNWHVSKSFYVWIVLYLVLMLCFALAIKLKDKKVRE